MEEIKNIYLYIIGYGKKLFGPRREKTCLRGFANNKGADQPAHPHLSFAFLKASYLNFLQAKFHFSS